VVGIVKDNTDQESWFSAKPIKVGNFSNILVGTELNLRQIIYLYISGDREDFIGEYVDSE